jgi:hypothetical protein
LCCDDLVQIGGGRRGRRRRRGEIARTRAVEEDVVESQGVQREASMLVADEKQNGDGLWKGDSLIRGWSAFESEVSEVRQLGDRLKEAIVVFVLNATAIGRGKAKAAKASKLGEGKEKGGSRTEANGDIEGFE